MSKSLIFAIDFDGTIVEGKFPAIGPAIPTAISTMKALQLSGHRIVIWTVRSGKYLDAIKSWFLEKGFTPDAYNEDLSGISESRKICAHVYIDDRNFPPFSGWEEVRKTFL